jgi:pyruvate dehydrogenase E2 component (dihydrolipoamide acetyltransferase)
MGELVMPRLSDTMEEGTILRWLVADKAIVQRGQELVEIETDKANMTYESDLEGVLEIVAAEGDTLPIGALIARVGAAAEPAAVVAPSGEPAAAGPDNGPARAQPAFAPEHVEQPASAKPAGAAPAGIATPAGPPHSGGPPSEERVKASPLARRLARERNVDLHALAGSGPGGRVVKADVEAAAAGVAGGAGRAGAGRAQPSAHVAGLAGVATAKGETTEIELSRTQQTIARRMAESKATIPHFALELEIDMQECAALRAQLKGLAADAPGAGRASAPAEAVASSAPGPSSAPVPTYNDMVVKACALALREHPRANSSYRDGRLQLHSRVNVGVAVAIEGDSASGGALIVPTVFDADRKSLGEIARETRVLAGRVRDGSITPPELGGGTFTVSNLGMFGVTSFTAIINPPQAAILSVGSVQARPVVRDRAIVVGERMTATLACDHRILYGADAARFLARIRELLERPASLTL